MEKYFPDEGEENSAVMSKFNENCDNLVGENGTTNLESSQKKSGDASKIYISVSSLEESKVPQTENSEPIQISTDQCDTRDSLSNLNLKILDSESVILTQNGLLVQSEIHKLKHSKILESKDKQMNQISKSNTVLSNILPQLIHFSKSSEYQALSDWENIIESLTDLHLRRLKIHEINQKQFPDKNKDRSKFLNRIRGYSKKIRDMKDTYLNENANEIASFKDPLDSSYLDLRAKQDLFTKFSKESKLMEKEYKFLHKKYQQLAQQTAALKVKNAHLESEVDYLKSQQYVVRPFT
ncbi:unnamed protein product [Moneuplotes crassus]|uniref:Uncharacterized protein n=1 Tax=Euplotes crassus TaxID=5936 RepID=A0AAD1UMT7_EUPCR|nr:unnamed protein product [Moneuplotes crassus]